jgi:hypothetical protein
MPFLDNEMLQTLVFTLDLTLWVPGSGKSIHSCRLVWPEEVKSAFGHVM